MNKYYLLTFVLVLAMFAQARASVESKQSTTKADSPKKFLSGGCDYNCMTCSGTVCTKCYSRYYLSGGSCYSCSSNCLSCTSYYNCYSCSSGYSLSSDGYCYMNSSFNIAPLISIMILACLCFCICKAMRSKRNGGVVVMRGDYVNPSPQEAYPQFQPQPGYVAPAPQPQFQQQPYFPPQPQPQYQHSGMPGPQFNQPVYNPHAPQYPPPQQFPPVQPQQHMGQNYPAPPPTH